MNTLSKLTSLIVIIFISCNKENNKTSIENKKAKWIENAFLSLESDNYPNIKAVSWWHENFDGSFLKINSSTESLESYKNGINSSLFHTEAQFNSNKLIESNSGIYHAAFPDFGGTEDVVSTQKITDFESLVNKNIAWAYFSNNWLNEIQFPINEVNIINSAGKIPFIRMMPRTNFNEGGPDPNYTMQRILDGDFDTELTQWAIDAANTSSPLLVEFGTEVNGNWFPWNGQFNGAEVTTAYGDQTLADGPERFRDAYRHIIDICNNNGATNITWFFHVNAFGYPKTNWNKIENYYPGDNYIDWFGVSVYGPQRTEDDFQEFAEIMDVIYPELIELSNKPIAILEFAITEIE
jgi:hypothetical protein